MQTVEGQAHPICGAKTRSGGVCHGKPMANGRCRMHGGKAPRGRAHYNFKDGSQSKYAVPDRLLERFLDHLNDPALMELNTDVALLTTRRDELLGKLDQKDTGAAWLALKTNYRQLQTAFRERDTIRASALLSEMERIIEQGASDALVWKEILQVEDQRVETIDTWFDQTVKSDQVIPVSHLAYLVGQFIQAVRDNVQDRAAIAAIAAVADRALLDSATRRP